MRPGGLNFPFTLSHSPPTCSLFEEEEAVSSPTTSYSPSTAWVHLQIPSPFGLRGAQLLLVRFSPLASSPSSLFFTQLPLLGSSASSLSFLPPLLPKQRCGDERAWQGSRRGEARKSRADGRRAAPGVLQTFRGLSPWEEEDRSWGNCGWGV